LNDLVQSILVDVLCISWSVGHTHTENAMIQGELQFHCDVLQTENLFCQLHLLSGKYLQQEMRLQRGQAVFVFLGWRVLHLHFK